MPDIDPNKRKEVANRLKPEGMDIPENLFDIFEKEEFKYLFSKDSKAEVPIVGVVDNQVISGQIDRLVITQDSVLIVDFKSGKHVPTNETFVPMAYIKQMMMYKKLLKKIFPDKMVKTFLLWTENLSLMELTQHDI